MCKINRCKKSAECSFFKQHGYCSRQIGTDCKNEKLKFGDCIRFFDSDEMNRRMQELAEEGIETDFLYELDGRIGMWLEVISIS